MLEFCVSKNIVSIYANSSFSNIWGFLEFNEKASDLCVFCLSFFYEISVFLEKNLQWDLCLCPEADGCSQTGQQLSQGPGAELLWAHPSVSCPEEKGHWSSGVCVGTSASHEVWGYIPRWPAWIRGAKAFYLSSFLLNPCLCFWPCLCLWEQCFRTDVMVLTNFTSALETNRFFPATSALRMCVLFYSSLSFKCFYYELGDECIFFWACFQSWVPFVEYPRAINHFVLCVTPN